MRRFSLGVAVAAAGIYCCNRFVASIDFVLPYAFAHYHLNDLCGGVLFPAYVDLLSWVVRRRRLVTSLPRLLLLCGACCVCWEVLAPLFLSRSTGDVVDAVMYLLGGVVYCATALRDDRMGSQGATT